MNKFFKFGLSKHVSYRIRNFLISPLFVFAENPKKFCDKTMASAVINTGENAPNPKNNLSNLKDFQIQSMIKSQNDPMEYKLIVLENGLRALLVSDVKNIIQLDGANSEVVEEEEEIEENENESDEELNSEEICCEDDERGERKAKGNEEKMAACALCIGVGSFSDPPDIPGLAHFLEHMVFMGSKKHPQENGFDEFIKKHGGSDNGVTECETTSFYLECNEKYLREGMDRFAQFFISPLMKKEAMTREREIIHSEFEMSLPSDGSRREQILALFAPPGHPSGKFLWGNLTTLRDNISDEVLYEKVHEFRNRHYSAHRMTLSVQARLPLDTLEEYVRESFSEIPCNNLPPDNFDEYIGTFGYENFNNLIYVKPVKDICQVHLTWVLPSYMKEYKSRPLDYLGWLIGHEGEGSLISYLRRKVWALQCVAGNDESGYEHNSIYAFFTVELTLTVEGYRNLDQVLEALFSYISMLRKKCPDEKVFKELQTICETNFRYKTEMPAADYVELLTESMHLYEPVHYIAGGELYLEYKPELITEILKNLTQERVNIIIHSKEKRDDFYDKIEPWFQTPYKVEEIPEKWREKWAGCSLENFFHIPNPNLYLTTEFALLNPPEKTHQFPVKVIDNELVELWYRQDVKFKRPIAFYAFYLISPLPRTNPLNAALLDILVSFLSVKFVEQMYPANQAGLNFTFMPAELGLHLHFSGYNEKLPLFFDEILNLIRKYCQDINNEENLDLFNAIIQEKSRGYYNSFLKPESMVKMARLSILVDKFWTSVERRAAMDQITLETFHKFAGEFLSKGKILGLVQGNISEKDAIGLCGKFPEILGCSPLNEPKPQIKVTKLDKGELCLRLKSFNETDSNSVVTNYYQAGPTSIRTSCIIDLIMMLMDEPLFDNLRTKQQIGYDIYCLLRDTFGVLGFSVTVYFQINKFKPDEVDERIESFLTQFSKNLKEISKSEMEETKASLIVLKSNADLQLGDEVKRNFAEICANEYIFDRSQKEIATIPEITQEEICKWFQDHIIAGREFKKLSVQIIGSSKQNDAVKSDVNTDEKRVFQITPITGENKNMVFITDVEEYKGKRQFYIGTRGA